MLATSTAGRLLTKATASNAGRALKGANPGGTSLKTLNSKDIAAGESAGGAGSPGKVSVIAAYTSSGVGVISSGKLCMFGDISRAVVKLIAAALGGTGEKAVSGLPEDEIISCAAVLRVKITMPGASPLGIGGGSSATWGAESSSSRDDGSGAGRSSLVGEW